MKALIEVIKLDVNDVVTTSTTSGGSQGCVGDNCAEQW